jgi:hypothetical protein
MIYDYSTAWLWYTMYNIIYICRRQISLSHTHTHTHTSCTHKRSLSSCKQVNFRAGYVRPRKGRPVWPSVCVMNCSGGWDRDPIGDQMLQSDTTRYYNYYSTIICCNERYAKYAQSYSIYLWANGLEIDPQLLKEIPRQCSKLQSHRSRREKNIFAHITAYNVAKVGRGLVMRSVIRHA